MKNLNLVQKLVWVEIIVLMGLFPSWACGTPADDAAARFRKTVNQLRQDKADFEARQRGDWAVPPTPTKQPTQEEIRVRANRMAAGHGLDMKEGSSDYRTFWQIVDNGGLPQELDGKPFNKHPFQEQVRWVVNKVKAGRPPPVAQVPTPTPGTLPPGVGQDREHPLPGGFGGAKLSTLPPGIAPPPNQETLPVGPALKKPFIDMSDLGFGGSTAPAPVAPPVDTTPIIILLILAVVCLIFYFTPHLPWLGEWLGKATRRFKKPKDPHVIFEQERPGPIEEQESEVSAIPVEGKKDRNVIRKISEASSTTCVIVGLIILLLLLALAMTLYWRGETRDYQKNQLQLQEEQKKVQEKQVKMLEDIKNDQEKIKRNQEKIGKNQRRIIREQNEPHFVIPLH